MLNLDDAYAVETPPLRPEEPMVSSGITWQDLQEQRRAGEKFSVAPELASRISDSRERIESDLGAVEFGIGEDLFVDEKQNQGYITTASGAPVRNNNIGRLTEAQDANTATLLGQEGLDYHYKQDEYKGYRYNPNTGEYDYYDNTPSNFDKYAPALVKAGITAVATAGIGNTLAGSSALSGLAPATAKAIGQAAAAGIASGIQGGDAGDILKSAALGGLAGYSKGLNAAAAEAQQAADVYGASSEAVKAASELAAQAEVMENVKTGINLVRSVSSGNVLGTIANTLKLSGLDNPQTMVEDFIHDKVLSDAAGMGESAIEDWLFYNSDHVATSVLNFTDQITKGEDFEDSVKSAVKEYVVDGGGFADLIPEGSGFTVETPEFIERIGDVVKEGASQLNEKIIRPVMDTAGQIVDGAAETVRETGREIREDLAPVTEAVRETGREIREDIDPAVTAVRETGRDIKETASELNEEYVRPVADAAGEVVDEVVDTVKDYGDEFGDLANNLIKGMLGGLAAGGAVSQGGTRVAASTGSAPSNQFIEPRLVKGFDLDTPFVNPLLRG